MAQIIRPKYEIFLNPVLSTIPVELPQWDCPSRIFHAVPACFSIFNNNIKVLLHSQATFGTKHKYLLEKMVPVELPYKAIMELPLAEWGSAAVF